MTESELDKQMSFPELLKVLRGSRSLRDIEQVTGLSNAYLSQIETGKVQSVSVETLRIICNLFPDHREMILKSLEIL